MRLTWRDVLATAVVAAAGALYAWHLADPGLAVVGSARWASVAVFVLGVTACALGSDTQTVGSPYASTMSAGGGLAGLLTAATLVTDSAVTLAGVVGIVGLLWLVTTMRHALGIRVVGRAPAEPSEMVGAGVSRPPG